MTRLEWRLAQAWPVASAEADQLVILHAPDSMHRRLRCGQTHLFVDFHVFVDLRVLEGEAG